MGGTSDTSDVGHVVVVSDVHLSAEWDPASDGYRAGADFPDTSSFVHFLDDLRHRLPPASELVVLGDLFDFAHVELEPTRAVIAPLDSALAKLRAIASANVDVLAALRRLAANHISVHIVAGNHDIELVLPPVQKRLDELIRQKGVPTFTFHPWIYYAPGLLYAEHGQQYHDLNAFSRVLDPVRADGALEAPLGSIVDDCMRAWRRGDRLSVAALHVHRHLVNGVRSELRRRRVARRAHERAIYRAEALRSYAGEVGLPHTALIALDAISEARVRATGRRLLKRALSLRTRARYPSRDYMWEASVAIHELLEATGAAVPRYVFGHTHRPCRLALAGAEYINGGTWSTLTSGVRSTFIEIVRHGDGTSSARLCRWNDVRGCAEVLPDPEG